ncbi:hypothetical protein AABM17_676 [Neisseria musculi]|uniref:Uncharacterized protein n=1 Tax=Neisseria musculi TaxID=1815583 RepID=A0A7H1M8H2_9NEIS|nr:hypothetical protein H7A79_0676 [Neisseria musculi]
MRCVGGAVFINGFYQAVKYLSETFRQAFCFVWPSENLHGHFRIMQPIIEFFSQRYAGFSY